MNNVQKDIVKTFGDNIILTANSIIETKNVILYLFGNPYVLNLFKITKAKAVVVVYQNFEVFQQNAAQHFLGKEKAQGILPITLDEIVP